MPRTLSAAEIERYHEQGYLVIHDAVPAARLAQVQAETERMLEVASTISEPTAALDLDPAHTPEQPRVRRIKSPHQHSEFFHAFLSEPLILSLLDPLMPSGIRVHNTKINTKSAGVGEAIEWHQDWAFYPHTNQDVLAVGIYLDDCTEDNGPMMVIPGSHKGPVYDHHTDGYFCGAMDPDRCDCDFGSAVPLMGPAGTLTIHHARLVHGSAFNRSSRPRRFLLQAYAAADAWPLHDLKGSLADFDARLVRGAPTLAPRMEAVPVRIPLPLRPDVRKGSIYDNQSILANRYFDDARSRAERGVAAVGAD
ncbi:MAG: phytanoyl-CoA dioxygenase family protein [Gammaproteobacteria bacterium]|nr:phytanoyl-CoA dioxygenase family protein [Gammaproteobacteria bacterium]